MPKKKALLGLILLFFTVDAAIIFHFMNPAKTPSAIPLTKELNSPPGPRETYTDLPIPEEIQSDRIVVQKSSRALTLYRGKEALKTYRISLGGNPLGHKEFEGDQKTPEGNYQISGHNPKSDYHLSLRISYPNPTDTAHAREAGRSAGGDIMIHGLPNKFIGPQMDYSMVDWTAGCLAVTNDEIEEIFRAVPDGTPIEIRP